MCRLVAVLSLIGTIAGCGGEDKGLTTSCFGSIPVSPNNEYYYVAADTDGRVVVTASDDGLEVREVENRVGTLVATVPGVARHSGVVMDGRVAFFNKGGDLISVDLTNPSQPQILQTAPFVVEGRGLVLVGKRLYRAEGGAIRVIDVTDPSAMVQLGHATVLTSAIESLQFHEGRLFAANQDRQLAIISLANPDVPAYETFFQAMTNKQAFWGFKSHYAYYGFGEEVGVVDIGTTPPTLIREAKYTVVSTTVQSGGFATLGNTMMWNHGDYDVSDPANPVRPGIHANCRYLRGSAIVSSTLGYAIGFDEHSNEHSIEILGLESGD